MVLADTWPDRSGPAIGVLGARGGLGASALAATLAQRAAATRPVTIVESDPWACGLDVAIGVEAEGGLRWPDLPGRPGMDNPHALRAALPFWERVGVLAHRRPAGEPIRTGTRRAVVQVLRAGGMVVVDLSRTEWLGRGAEERWFEPLDALVLVVSADVASVFGARDLLRTWSSRPPHVAVAIRTPGSLAAAEVEEAMEAIVGDIAGSSTFRWGKNVARQMEQGLGPVIARSSLRRTADHLLKVLCPSEPRRRG